MGCCKRYAAIGVGADESRASCCGVSHAEDEVAAVAAGREAPAAR